MKKAIAGSVLAAAAVAGLFGAGTAQAAPGVSVNVNGHESGIGDHGTLTGASTTSTKGNVAVATTTPSRSAVMSR